MSVYFSGMISGMDTEELIRQLMALERRPITLMKQKVSRIEEQQSAWRDVNTRLSNLESKLKELLDGDLFAAMKATSSAEEVAKATVRAGAPPATYRIEVKQLAQAHVVAGGEVAEDLTLSGDGTLRLQVGSGEVQTVTLQAGASLHDVAKAINDQAEGVRASVVNVDGTSLRLVLEGLASGAGQEIVVEAQGGGALLTELGLENLETLQAAQNAKFTLNGLEIERGTNEISDAIQGVTFTLQATGETTITVGQDVDGVVAKIKAVVDQYNSFYTFSQEKLAKEAVLQGDSALIQLVSRVRSAFTEPIGQRADWTTGGLNQLALIGVTTTREGTLTLDETVLREKLAEDPLAVQRLFTAKEDGGVTGVARRAVDLVQQYTRSSGLISSRQSMYRDMIDDINDQIDSFELRLQRREETMRAQFIRMEQMLAMLNAQANALAGQLAQISALSAGGGGGAG